MSNKNLTNTQRNAFLARVTNKNMNLAPIKQEITNTNTTTRKQKQESMDRASKLNSFLNTLNLTNENKKTFKNQLIANNTNASLNTIKTQATAMNTQRKQAEANRKRQQNREDLNQHLKTLTHLTNADMQGYITSFNSGGSLQNLKNVLKKTIEDLNIPNDRKKQYFNQINKPYANIGPIQALVNKNAANVKAARDQLKKNVAAKLQALNTLEKANRTKFMNRLNANGPNKVLTNATKLNANRKEAKRLEEEKKAKEQQMKNVAAKLLALNTLEKANRTKFMNRLNANGPNKVIANATKMNANRKEAKRLEEEREAKRLEEEKKAKEQQMKNVAAKLQALNTLEKANRKTFMNRLNANGPNKVLNNATKLNANRKEAKRLEEEKKAKEQQMKNVAAKLQALNTLEKTNRKALMNRLNVNGPNKVIANATKLNANRKEMAKKKAEEEKAKKFENERKPLFNKIIKEIPGKTGVFRREWESLVRKATTKEEHNAINAQLSEKIQLRNEIRASNISNKEKSGHESWIMKRGNDVSKRRQELTGQLKAKKNAANAVKKNTASKLQALNTLEKANRTAFMARLNKGNSQSAILGNATKMNQNRRAAEREKIEKERRDKLRKNTAKLLQNKKKLTRDNRKKFMNRLEKGENPNTVIKEANKLDSNRLTREGIEWKLNQIKGLTSKDVESFMKRWDASKNKTIFDEARKLVKTRESGFSFNNTNRPKKPMTPAQRFNTNTVGNAKKEIRAMTGMGVKNRNRFVARIDKGEVASKVLNEARKRNKKGASAKSKTVKNLELQNVLRRL